MGVVQGRPCLIESDGRTQRVGQRRIVLAEAKAKACSAVSTALSNCPASAYAAASVWRNIGSRPADRLHGALGKLNGFIPVANRCDRAGCQTQTPAG